LNTAGSNRFIVEKAMAAKSN